MPHEGEGLQYVQANRSLWSRNLSPALWPNCMWMLFAE